MYKLIYSFLKMISIKFPFHTLLVLVVLPQVIRPSAEWSDAKKNNWAHKEDFSITLKTSQRVGSAALLEAHLIYIRN